jgi:pimeloyl-ACP methyl ester carboxylesterase
VSRAALAHDDVGAGAPLILLHGHALDRRVWAPCVEALAREHRVVACDLRGYGQSPPPREGEPYRHADDVLGLAAALGLERPTVMGLSMGGGVALDAALLAPGALSGLVLVGSLLPGRPLAPEVIGPMRAARRDARERGVAAGRAAWLAQPLFDGAAPEAAAMVEDYSGWHWQHADPDEPLRPPAAERLGDVTLPALVLVGERDVPDFRAISSELAERIPDAELLVLPGAGHLAPLDAPAALVAAVLPFVGRTSA